MTSYTVQIDKTLAERLEVAARTAKVAPADLISECVAQHLDIAVADLDEAVRWALGAGAVLADVQPREAVRVMLDPAGHPFYLFQR